MLANWEITDYQIRQPGCSRFLGRSERTCGTCGPSRRTLWDLNLQPVNICVFQGAGSTTELSPTPFWMFRHKRPALHELLPILLYITANLIDMTSFSSLVSHGTELDWDPRHIALHCIVICWSYFSIWRLEDYLLCGTFSCEPFLPWRSNVLTFQQW